MGKTVIEKILAAHSGKSDLAPGDIVDVEIDARVARDFGGANVVRQMEEHGLEVRDPSRTFFTFDCNPTGSDQRYAVNQHLCRQYARKNGIRVYDIDKGIGTHILIEEGLAFPGSTAVSTDSHANILGAVGAFGQGMGDKDIAAAWHKGSVWFKVPQTVKIILEGKVPEKLSAKDIALNLLGLFGPSTLLGCAIEVEGAEVEKFTLDQRITISSMATEMGAITILFPPNLEVLRYCESRAMRKVEPPMADHDARYKETHHVDLSTFIPMVSRPGKPHDTVSIPSKRVWIDSAFVGSCTNGRIEDMREVAAVLKGKHVATGVVLKIVPATDRVWQQCLEEGLIEVFKEAGGMVSNAGCAGCAAGQVGQNGPGEVTVSTGNRNFPGKQGQGEVYLASPSVVAASAVSGYITQAGAIPSELPSRKVQEPGHSVKSEVPSGPAKKKAERPVRVTGRVRLISRDNIDTDMIFHNRYLTVTDPAEMGKYTFDNLKGFEDFASKSEPGDIVVTGKNFGSGSSRQQAVDCFVSLGIQCIVSGSFGAIYERNAINAAFPIVTAEHIDQLKLKDGDQLQVDFEKGEIRNLTRDLAITSAPFSEVQLEIYQNNGLF
ncbi:MAG: aconitase/3-isopropylmalate dehydratase large subunit family protein [Bacteroidales bacterium]